MHKFQSLLLLLVFLIIAGCVPQGVLTPLATTVLPLSPASTPTISTPSTETPTSQPSPSPSVSTESASVPREPLWIQFGSDLTNRVVTVNPESPMQMAYCSAGEIHYTDDGGASWQTITTKGVASAAESSGYQDFSQDPSQPYCFSAFQDPRQADSFYAVFSTVKPEYGAPPLFFMGFFTTDRGASWQIVSPPPESSLEHFGGFWSDGSKLVQALFIDPNTQMDTPGMPLVLETTDGGMNWSAAVLTCPPAGLCLRWGPAASMIPGMGSPLPQPAYLSKDGGGTWEAIEPPVELRLPGPNQLISYSESAGARISGEIMFSVESSKPVILTQDNGQTWHEFPLPALPDAGEIQGVYPGLQLLPDGSLISQGAETPSWYLLPPGDAGWCSLKRVDLPSYPVQLAVSVDQVWWLTLDTGEVHATPLESLTCP